MWYLAIGLAARGWESHNLEIWWNSDSFFVSFEVTLSGSQVPGYNNTEVFEYFIFYTSCGIYHRSIWLVIKTISWEKLELY